MEEEPPPLGLALAQLEATPDEAAARRAEVGALREKVAALRSTVHATATHPAALPPGSSVTATPRTLNRASSKVSRTASQTFHTPTSSAQAAFEASASSSAASGARGGGGGASYQVGGGSLRAIYRAVGDSEDRSTMAMRIFGQMGRPWHHDRASGGGVVVSNVSMEWCAEICCNIVLSLVRWVVAPGDRAVDLQGGGLGL